MVAKIQSLSKQGSQESLGQHDRISPAALLYQYCKDIDDWPMRWKGMEEDVAIGQSITEKFKLFLIDCIEKKCAKKTIKTHADYLWALGGELIRQINYDDSDRELSAKNLILKYINEFGGPLWRHASNEADHARYDSVCRQLFKFLNANPG